MKTSVEVFLTKTQDINDLEGFLTGLIKSIHFENESVIVLRCTIEWNHFEQKNHFRMEVQRVVMAAQAMNYPVHPKIVINF